MKHFATTGKPVAAAVATVSKDHRSSDTIGDNPHERQTEATSAPQLTWPRIERPGTHYRQRFHLKPFINPRTGSQSWRVLGFRRDGTRIRENFTELKSAECRQVELTMEWLARETETAVRATKLTETQVKLAETAFVRLDADHELMLAVEYWLNHGRQNAVAESPRLDDAVAAFNEWLKTAALRNSTKRNLQSRVNVFVNSIGNLRVANISPEVIDGFLDNRLVDASSKDNDRRAVSRFFSWCMDRKRRWMAANPCRAVRVERGEKPPPVILTLAECRDLLKHARNFKNGRLVPYLAVCLFGGLRPFEAARLEWQSVNLVDREIRLEGNQTKTGVPRVVSMCPTLLAWLEAFEGQAFNPRNWRKDFDAIKRSIGYGRWTRTDGKAAGGLKPWPVDVLRHTAISYYFRQTGSYGRTAEQFGNSEAIIKKHYQARVSSADTKEFYALLPP